MGTKSRRKGRHAEQQLVLRAKEAGLPARRTWQTASSDDPKERLTDVVIGAERIQSKRLKKLPKLLQDGLEGVDALAVREDNGGWLVVVTLDRYLEFLKGEQCPAEEK